MADFDSLEQQIRLTMRVDQHRLRLQLRSIRNAAKQGRPFDRNLSRLISRVEASVRRRESRAARRPTIDYSGLNLPVLERRDEIAAAIRDHSVVVVSGETGSGKSTQLPKIALELGRGVEGLIGHTQPRRIAARSIAQRVADELGCEVGQEVGFKVRFADATGPGTFIKLMTDGILLAESAGDRFLDNYDTIIIDEAHERSLNIDFLLGYLRRLLPRRPDLRLIITSATIDALRFQEHFRTANSEVPIIEVSGRTYPVEVRYRPLVEDAESASARRGREWHDGVLEALGEVTTEGPGDVLVFLPTERDIREVARRMRGRFGDCDVLPLYGRLSPKDQQRVFSSSSRRRVVLATNVAESSVTVPGIRFVIDTGTARISRYSSRSRIQRLPIEAVSRASADQRKGRCGRIGPGICIRLYEEADYLKRDEYTQPEILRSNLAAVILRAIALRLGSVEEFPFLDPPRPATIRDGYRTLYELGATDEANQLTEIGQRLSHLPVDPRIGRMILAGIDEHCLHEILVIAAALEIQDPRDRPVEKQEAADQAHEQFRHEESDFLSLLNVWNFFREQKQKLSHSRLRKACQQNFLNYNRMREWGDLYRQLRDLITNSSDPVFSEAARGLSREACDDYDAIHRALLAGLLSGVATRNAEAADYIGADQVSLVLWPGSVLAAKKPRWFVAAELVETTRRYARTAARIQPNWIEPLAQHLVTRSYSEPHWHEKSSSVMAWEKVSLFGLPVVPRRRVPFGPVDEAQAREIFIRSGLVERQLVTDAPFFVHNGELMEEIEAMQARTRRADLVPDEDLQFEFYDRLIPADVCSGAQFDKWRRRAEARQPRLLFFRREDFVREDDATAARSGFPDALDIGCNRFPLKYHLEPGAEDDGITITVPRAGLAHVPAERLGWLVPGLLEDKVVALIRSLPKHFRRRLVPAPETAKNVVAALTFGQGELETEVARVLTRIAGEVISAADFDHSRLPRHLRMNVQVVDDTGDAVTSGRDVVSLQRSTPREDVPAAAAGDWVVDGMTEWAIDDLPVSVEIVQSGMWMAKFPALLDRRTHVDLRLLDDAATAEHECRSGVRRLFVLQAGKKLDGYLRRFPGIEQTRLICSAIPGMEIDKQLGELLAERALFRDPNLPRSRTAFEQRIKLALNGLSVALQEVADLVPVLFAEYQVTFSLLSGSPTPAWADAYADATRQLGRLIQPGFLLATPWPWLLQIPRYLEAIRYRIERLAHGSLQSDTRSMREVTRFEELWRIRADEHQQRGLYDPHLVAFRWMIEEYRVSLFAQKLGTAVPVSAKRLERQWKRTVD